MIIENLTHPNQEPQDGDLLRYIYDSGAIVEKNFYAHQEPSQDEVLKMEHAAYLVYREELRDYPQQADFPDGDRPTRP